MTSCKVTLPLRCASTYTLSTIQQIEHSNLKHSTTYPSVGQGTESPLTPSLIKDNGCQQDRTCGTSAKFGTRNKQACCVERPNSSCLSHGHPISDTWALQRQSSLTLRRRSLVPCAETMDFTMTKYADSGGTTSLRLYLETMGQRAAFFYSGSRVPPMVVSFAASSRVQSC